MTPAAYPGEVSDVLGIGARVGRYELIEPLGRGAVGMVWKAWSEARGQMVALKMLRILDPDIAERAHREARAQARIRSDHVVALHEVFLDRGAPVLAMEYVSGSTLLDLLQTRRLGLHEADELARGLFLGLAAAHEEGVIHRDIKPGNILVPAVDGPLQPKLADFGLARIDAAIGQLTGTGVLLGTVGYMAPEQIGDPRNAGVPADVFSLGVVLYRIVTGSLPFASARRDEVLALTRAARHVPVATMRPETPPRMVAAIESALRVNPAERPSDVDALRAIWDGLADPPTLLQPAPPEVSSGALSPLPSEPPSTNVLRPPLALCGRRAERDLLVRRTAEWPVVTVLGLGGVGKTRLAIEAALEHRDRGGSAWLIDLEHAADRDALCIAVGAVLGTRFEPADPLGAVGRALARRTRPLLILDHAEALRDELAAAMGRWAGSAPDARFLVTTRRYLGLPGEALVELGPLDAAAAVELFEQQAQAVKPVFALHDANREAVTELVERLGRLPLAVEIAASRVRMLPPARLLERLGPRLDLVRGAGPGASRLDAMLRWSWAQLEDWGRAALGACSVFQGGFTLEAAEAVLGPVLDAHPDAPWPMDALQVLVDHCLVRVLEPLPGVERFTLPATVRAFATEQRTDATSAATHATWFARFGDAERMRRLTGSGGGARTRILALERDNLEAGARSALSAADGPAAAGCALAWSWLARSHGPFDAGARLLGQVLLLDGIPPLQAARLWRALGLLQRLGGRLDAALDAFGEAATAFARQGDSRHEGIVRGNRADVLSEQGADAEATREYGRALALLAADPASDAVIRGNLANLLRRMGDLDGAEAAYRGALAVSRQLEDRRAVAMTQANLASLLMDQGRLDAAEAAYADALAATEAQDDVRTTSLLLGNLGLLHRARGNEAAAVEAFERAIARAREVGHPANECLARGNLGDLWLDRGELARAEEQLSIAVALGDRALPLAGAAFRGSLGELRVRQGNRAEGIALLRAAEAALDGRDPVELAKVRDRLARIG